MGKFRQILTELSARDTPIFSFSGDNSRKRQWIFTKLGTCIDLKEIWSGIANGKISSMYDRVICPRHDNGPVLMFYVNIWQIIHAKGTVHVHPFNVTSYMYLTSRKYANKLLSM